MQYGRPTTPQRRVAMLNNKYNSHLILLTHLQTPGRNANVYFTGQNKIEKRICEYIMFVGICKVNSHFDSNKFTASNAYNVYYIAKEKR